MPIEHYFTHFASLGGAQTLLRLHADQDAKWGLASHFNIFFEPTIQASHSVSRAGFTWRSSIRSARALFCQHCRGNADAVAVYHDGWGAQFLADLEINQRRVAVFHGDHDGFALKLSSLHGLFDGILYVGHFMEERIRHTFGELEQQRIQFLPVPVASPPSGVAHSSLRQRPIRLGFASRMVRKDKRADDLPNLVQVLDGVGMDYHLDVLGDGPLLPGLRAKLSGHPRVSVHGYKSGTDYTTCLASLDAMISLSDHEGMPLAILESMRMGILPVHPRIEGGAVRYIEQLDPSLLYDREALASIANAVTTILNYSEEDLAAKRVHARELVSAHTTENYQSTFATFVRKIGELPRISQTQFNPRPLHWADHVPFALLGRLPAKFQYRATPFKR